MKKIILIISAITILLSCAKADSIESAEVNVIQENQEAYKEAAGKIKANEKAIADLKTRIKDEKKEAREDHQKRIAVLEQKNKNLKKKLEKFKTNRKAEWEKFKITLNAEADEIAESFKNFR